MLLAWRPHLEKRWFGEQPVFSLPACSIPSSSLRFHIQLLTSHALIKTCFEDENKLVQAELYVNH